jgi:hypothetical protein
VDMEEKDGRVLRSELIDVEKHRYFGFRVAYEKSNVFTFVVKKFLRIDHGELIFC